MSKIVISFFYVDMSCNTCSRAFSLLRPEKGCPNCGFSFCSKCLSNKIFVKKLNSEKKVCAKCSRNKTDEGNIIPPPDSFNKRYAKVNESTSKDNPDPNNEILERLQKLKEQNIVNVKTSDNDLSDRLKNLKGAVPNTSDAELYSRLAKVKGVPIDLINKKSVLPTPDLRTEQQQADDLLKQYIEQSQIDTNYTGGFKDSIDNIETRLKVLRDSHSSKATRSTQLPVESIESEDEETEIKRIVEKVKADVAIEDISPNSNDELPFCEICNEDAQVRCRGCKYLFCMRCFNEHKDDDDCNKFDIYKPPKTELQPV